MTRTRHAFGILRALSRPGFTIILVLSEVIGLLQRRSLPSTVAQCGITMGILAWMVASTALNDIADEDIDRVNLVDDARRVLVTGLATRRQLIAISVTMCGIAIAGASLGGWRAAVIMIGAVGLSAAYSLRPIRLSDRGLLTSLLLPIGYVGVPFLLVAESAPATITPLGWWALGGLAVAFVGRLALKDFRDVDGDRLFGKRTLLVRHGRKRVCAFTTAFYALGSVPLLVVTRGNATVMLDAAILSLLTIALIARLGRSAQSPDDARTISDVALLGRGQLVLVAIALGQVSHSLTAAEATASATALFAATLFSSWIDHSRLRYLPADVTTCAQPISTARLLEVGGDRA